MLKLVEEEDYDVLTFWKNLKVLDAVYKISPAWKSIRLGIYKKKTNGRKYFRKMTGNFLVLKTLPKLRKVFKFLVAYVLLYLICDFH